MLLRGLARRRGSHRAGGVTISTDSDAFAQAHQRLVADPALQFDMPSNTPDPPPAWLEALVDFIRDNAAVLRPLFYAALIGFGLWLLWQVAKGLHRHWLEREGKVASDPVWRPQAAAARRLLEEADALAGQGRFGEAAHLLLHRSIEDIDARRPDIVRPALTSREIARLERLPGPARGAFATIAGLVERSLFARRPLDASGWDEARTAYADFALKGHWA